MEKFRFFKSKLQTKGPSIAKEKELKTLLEEKDTNVDKGTFKAGFEAATTSKHATDKILAMMKLRSMISTKKLEKDDKKTTHITFPLTTNDEGKIKKIPSSYGWSGVDTTIGDFITSYRSLGKLAKAKISWVIIKMHNPKELKYLADKPAERSEAREAVRAMLKFIQANPIEEVTPYIKVESSEDDAKPRIYTLNTECFKDTLKHYKISISEDFRDALDKYNGPKEGAFNRGLPAHGNKEIQAYNEALKELMEKGSIEGKYPGLTKDEIELTEQQWESFRTEIIKSRPTTFQELTEKVDRYLTTTSFKDLKTFFKLLETVFSEQDDENRGKQIKELTKRIPSDIPNVSKHVISDILYKIFPPTITQTTTTTDPKSFDAFSHPQAKDPFAELGSNEIKIQWKRFYNTINKKTPKSSHELNNVVKSNLKNTCFKDIKTVFELLGKALDETGEGKADKLKAAKEAITGDIEVGSEKIAKSEIEEIFDKITSASGTRAED